MYIYDSNANQLTVRQVEDMRVDYNIFEDNLKSYDNYLKYGVYEDMNYMLNIINDIIPDKYVNAEFRVGDLIVAGSKNDNIRTANMYYPVYARFNNGYYTTPEIKVFRIPYMDAECKLNVQGSRKVLLLEQKPSYSVSYDEKKQRLTVQAIRKSFKFDIKPKGIATQAPTRETVYLHALCKAALCEKDPDIDVNQLFSAVSILKNYYTPDDYSDLLNNNDVKGTGIFESYLLEDAELDSSRESLNEILQIDWCLSKVLSRECAGYLPGTLITQQVLKDFKDKHVSAVYVRDMPALIGQYLGEPTIIRYIPAGIKYYPIFDNIPMLQGERGNSKISRDYDLGDFLFMFNQNTYIDRELLELLYDCQLPCIVCRSSKTGNPITYRFEREVLSNHSYMEDGEWKYDYNDEDSKFLTTYDLVALLSLMTRIYETGKHQLENKDTGYLKKINLVSDTFSNHFRFTVRKWIPKCKLKVSNFINGKSESDGSQIFYGLYSQWRKAMIKAKVLTTLESINIVSEMSQVCNIPTILDSASEASDDMRRLAIPYFGRVCPYETPASKKLGLVNTKAIGAKVVNGLLAVPYRRVRNDGAGMVLSNDVVYLTAKEEQNYRIADNRKIEYEKDGLHIKNNIVPAIVPNPDRYGDKVIFANINAHYLDYVTCSSDQHLSPVACLMPFLNNNDANRISFGVGMYKQSVYLQQADKPRVTTFMYRDILNYITSLVVKAKKPGVVVDIAKGKIIVQYDDESEETVIDVKEIRKTNSSILFLSFRKGEGERFEEGDVLADTAVSREGVYSPARNNLVAYVSTAYNYEDGIEVTDNLTHKYFAIEPRYVSAEIHDSTSRANKLGIITGYQYVKSGTAAIEIKLGNRKSKDNVATVPIISDVWSGLLHSVNFSHEEGSTITYTCNLLSFKKLSPGDKMSGRHGNKGVVTHVRPTSEGFQLANGMTIEMCLNPLGIPSRMNMGQVMEAHCGLIATVLNIEICSDPCNGANIEDLKYLMNYAYTIANADCIAEDYNKFRSVAYAFTKLPEALHEHVWKNIDSVVEWAGTFNRDGDAMLYDPVSNTWLEHPVTIGVSHMFKLEQDSLTKEHERAGLLEEPYAELTKQPPKGASNSGGQRLAEMEIMGYAAYGAMSTLEEIMNSKSDNVGDRVNMHLEQLGLVGRVDEEYCVPRSYEVLTYLLEAMGVYLDVGDSELVDLDDEYARNKKILDVDNILARRHGKNKSADIDNEQKAEDVYKILKGV